MADTILVQETSATGFQSPLSPQRSQNSLYSAPELVPVDLYQTGSSLGGKPRDGSPALSSSFVLISDESRSGEQPLSSEYVEVSERVAVENKPSAHDQTLENAVPGRTGSSSAERVTDATKASPLSLPGGVDSTSDVQKWLEESVQHSGTGVPMETAALGLLPLLKPKITTLEMGTQTGHPYKRSRDGATQTLPEIKDSEERRQPTVATTPTSILDHTVSPLESPNDEVVDMSASTVLIERHISQKEGRMLKNSNKELRLKIKKLTEVLEQMQKENKRLKNEIESGIKMAAAQLALVDKEREHKRQIEELEEQQEMELEQYRREIQKATEYEERAEEKLKENAEMIIELQKTISALQEQLTTAQKENKRYFEKIEALTSKLKAYETKALVTESENSVLSEKINHLMKELATLKKSKHGHHHHRHHHQPHQQLQLDEKSKEHIGAPSSNKGEIPPIKDQSVEDVASKSGKEQELTKQDHLEKQEKPANDVTSKPAVASQPKPKPRQKQPYQPHNPQLQALASSTAGLNQKASKPKEKGQPPNRPVQALVAPKLQSVAHLQPLQQIPTGAKCGQEYLAPLYHQEVSKPTPPKVQGASVTGGQFNRPSFLPLKGQSRVPLQLVEPAQPPLPLSEAQKLAATASWVQQLPEPKERKQKIDRKQDQKITDKTEKQREEAQASVVAGAVGGNDLNSLSEERIEEISRQLKGNGGVVCECPICGKVLHSRESDYGVLLHVELCLQQSEAGAN